VLRFGTLIALIGLPIVLVLAWYHGDRGHQRPLRTEIAILALLLLTGGAGLWVYQRSTESTAELAAKPAAPPTAVPTARQASASVAVLPFSNLSSDPANVYLFGRSLGTAVTVALAAERGEQVRGIIREHSSPLGSSSSLLMQRAQSRTASPPSTT
jgi:pimeloyl-ACP methyl ester carboxylesterase